MSPGWTSPVRGRCRAIRSVIQPIRAGFMRCSGRIGPFGSHHCAASASNRATSAAETVPPVMVAPIHPPPVCVPASLRDTVDDCPAMSRIVMKFGGTSVADLDRIRNVAARVKREVDAGHRGRRRRLRHGWRDQPAGRLVPAARRRCTTRANTTRWSRPASR